VPRFAGRWADLGAALAAAERWLLPGACLLCESAVHPRDDDPLVCAACRARWSRLPDPLCERCGQPITPGVSCRLCPEWPVGFTGVRSAVWLEEQARRAVHYLKYEGWSRMAEPMADAMLPLACAMPTATLVPIPLSAARLRARGYNQSAELAGALQRRTGVPVASGALARRRDTGTQTALTPEARRANLAGAFVAVCVPPNPVLVDDVFTTGSTLAEAGAALLLAGAREVRGLTFARAPRPLAGAARGAQDI
jgi:predicted amidophosphoribosyltransferase